MNLDKLNKDENFPGGIGTGLNLPGGYINGAPTKKDDKEKDESIEELVLKNITDSDFEEFVNEYFEMNKVVNENESEKKDTLNHFVEYCVKQLKLKETPMVHFADENFAEQKRALGAYDPESKTIIIATHNRLSADIMRTLAHELVHRKQDELGLLKNPMEAGKTGSPIENQANAVAGIIMRNYGKTNKNIYQEGVIPGGKAEGKTLVDIAKKYAGDYYDYRNLLPVVKDQIKKGIKIEMEHTSDVNTAAEIARDHIWEDLHYYDKLAKVDLEEMGSNDIHFKNLMSKYRSSQFVKRINSYLFGKPTKGNADAVARTLRNMDYREITKMEKDLNLLPNLHESLIMEGGAAGHLAHPFEDEDLRFSDMKEMIKRGLIGGLDKEAPVSEKLDGQNIAFSVKNGNIVFGRNKGHVRNGGENALDVQGIAKQFAGRGGIEKAFTGAAEDLHAAIGKLKPEQVKKMFGNGSKFMSLEIILPDTTNVIPYGRSVLVMHGTIEYNKDGEQIGRSTEDASEFAKAVQKVGADKQKTFGIEGPKTIAFSDADQKEYLKKAKEYSNQLTQVQKQFGLTDKSKLEDYRRKWWLGEINRQEKELGIKFSPSQKKGLIKRWADGDKSFGVKNFEQPAQQQWFRDFETNKLQAAQKQMIKPIENVFLNAGAQTLKRVTNFLAANNPGAADDLRKETLQSIKGIKDSKDADKIAKLQIELERLNNIGMDKVVPSEGIVFQYGGKPYKFTGAFAPINQINGTFKFDKPKKETKGTEGDVQTKEEGGKTVAIFTGRFQPFHAGHYSIYEGLVNKFGKENVFIASSNAQDPVKSPFPFKDKKEIMTTMFGIPKNRVVQVKNPYSPVEILNKFPAETKYVTAVSQKDAERLAKGGGYFKNFDQVSPKKRKGYEDEGYYIVAPEMQLKVNGKNISGTQLRATFGSDMLSLPEKKKIFTQVYPKFDKDVFAKIVATTKKAEQAKAAGGKQTKVKPKVEPKGKVSTTDKLKSKLKSLDPKTQKRVQRVLQTKIKNPVTGNTILVKSALKYDDKQAVKKMAVSLVKTALGKK